MPASLSVIRNTNLKSIKLTILLLFSPLFFFAQTLTGLWVGTISNDSNTVRKDQSFEIALTEYRGKVYGYSRSEFIVDDVLYYVMKRVKGTIEGDVCEVKDDEIISFNFPKKIDKGVKVISTFYRNKNDGAWYLAGTWKTSQTKNYYSVTGKIDLKEEKDLTASKIFPHLEELKLADDVAFYKDRKEGPPIVKIAKPEKTNAELSAKKPVLSNNADAVVVSNKPTLQKAEVLPVPAESTMTAAATELKQPEAIPSSNEKNAGIVKAEAKKELPVTKEPAMVSAKTDTKNVAITSTPVISTAASQISPEDKKTGNITSSTKPETKSVVITTTPVNSTEASQASQKDKKADAFTSSNNPGTKSVAITTAPITSTATSQTSQENKKADISSSSTKSTTVAATSPLPEKREVKTEPLAKAVVKQEVPVAKTQQSTITKQPDIVQKRPETTSAVATNPATKINAAPEKTDIASTTVKKDAVLTTKPVVENKELKASTAATPLTPEIKKPDADITLKAALIAGRKSEFSQIVNFSSDSLELSLYDNGEVDGDTVTIFMNGEVILARQGLKASAIKKTIYITPGNEDFTLVMFAENLGKYPPNTGLLVVRDGDDVYNLRFSSDFEKNAGIVFRRKK